MKIWQSVGENSNWTPQFALSDVAPSQGPVAVGNGTETLWRVWRGAEPDTEIWWSTTSFVLRCEVLAAPANRREFDAARFRPLEDSVATCTRGPGVKGRLLLAGGGPLGGGELGGKDGGRTQ
jgi:hypothetical protein